MNFPTGSVVKKSLANAGHRLDPQVEKIPWRRKIRNALSNILARKFHGERSLPGYSP